MRRFQLLVALVRWDENLLNKPDRVSHARYHRHAIVTLECLDDTASHWWSWLQKTFLWVVVLCLGVCLNLTSQSVFCNSPACIKTFGTNQPISPDSVFPSKPQGHHNTFSVLKSRQDAFIVAKSVYLFAKLCDMLSGDERQQRRKTTTAAVYKHELSPKEKPGQLVEVCRHLA